MGSLLTHQIMMKGRQEEKKKEEIRAIRKKKVQELGVNVNTVALKSSKCIHFEDSSEEDSEEDEELAQLFMDFDRFLKNKMKKSSNHESNKKMKGSYKSMKMDHL